MRNIKRYIATELNSPAAALRMVTQITKRIRALATFPSQGAPLDSIIEIKSDFRYLVCESYLIFYRAKDDVVSIDRILYGRQNFVRVLFGPLSEAVSPE